MSRRTQRKAAVKKAFAGLPRVSCFNPTKVRFYSERKARAAAAAQGMRAYRCGDHYHLSSKRVP